MFRMTLSILGLYNQRNDIFDSFHLPEDVDMSTLKPLILSECAELEVLYPDPDTLKSVISAWSTARLDAWARMQEALTEEYNPLHNYDRTEQENASDTGTVRTDDDMSSTTSGTTAGTVSGDTTGYNTSTYTPSSKSTSSGTDISQGTRTRDNLETRNLAHARQTHIYGNIGVTTAAQMLAGELDIRKTDIYRIIADEFKRYFCLLVY